MRRRLRLAVLLIAVLGVSTSCRVKVEPKISVSDILSKSSTLIPAYVTLEATSCDSEESKKYVLGVVASYEGCRNAGRSFVKEWKIDVPLIQFRDIGALSSTPLALLRGKNNTLILYVNKDTIINMRRKFFQNNSNKIEMVVRVELLNDTQFPAKMAFSSVWVNDSIAVGQQLFEYDLAPNNFVTITMSETGVGAFLREGSEPLMIVPFDG